MHALGSNIKFYQENSTKEMIEAVENLNLKAVCGPKFHEASVNYIIIILIINNEYLYFNKWYYDWLMAVSKPAWKSTSATNIAQQPK